MNNLLSKFNFSKNRKMLVHPENYKLICSMIDEINPKDEYLHQIYNPDPFGIQIIVDETCPKYFQKWTFPKDPFVDYDESDKVWAIPIKYGRYVDDLTKPCFIILQEPEKRKSIDFVRDILNKGKNNESKY